MQLGSSAFSYIFIAISTLLVLVMVASMVGFRVSAIQLGMDQLHVSPEDHQSLFIHWYVWIIYMGLLMTRLIPSAYFLSWGILCIFFLPVSFVIVLRRRLIQLDGNSVV